MTGYICARNDEKERCDRHQHSEAMYTLGHKTLTNYRSHLSHLSHMTNGTYGTNRTYETLVLIQHRKLDGRHYRQRARLSHCARTKREIRLGRATCRHRHFHRLFSSGGAAFMPGHDGVLARR